MKKVILIFIIFLFPIYVFAYSKFVIPGGESIGIKINSEGLIVVGFYKVDNEYINKKNLKVGDTIISINGKNVYSINDINNVVDEYSDKVNIVINRNGRVIDTHLELKKCDGVIKTGLYIKDSVVGLGTLSYIDPVSKIYGALGHEIILNETNNKIEVRDGNILLSSVNGIDKSRNGYVGAKNASIMYNSVIGTILKNTNKGIYGMYTNDLPNKELIEVAEYDDIKLDNAYIYTVTSKNEINKYNIKITKKYNNSKDTQKAFSFEVIDNNLINETGGIVQGMSGSPIIQNNKIIGAVTNVVVDDVKRGYAISIITMLNEGES